MIARNDDGIEIWTFDKTLGQWRPAVDDKARPQVLTDFRSPLPSESGPNWTQPQYYSTIQTADLDGPGHGADIIARFPDGLRVYRYTPPKGTKSIDGGTWSLVSKNGPFSDADGYTDPSLYLSIHADRGNGNSADQSAEITAQSKSGPVTYFWTGSGWIPAGTQLRDLHIPYSNDPADYLNLGPATLATPDGVLPAVTTYDTGGVFGYYKQHQGANWHWKEVARGSNPGPFSTRLPCGGSNRECFDSSPSYYTTLRFANVDGKPGDELLGRQTNGLLAYKLSDDANTWKPLATLGDLKGTAHDFDAAPGRWGSIRTGDVLGNGRDQVLALDGNMLATWSYDPATNTWAKLSSSAPLKLGGDIWNKDASHYATIQVGDVTGDGHDAVIARGPYGIRTWFYDLHGNSGWTSWLPQDTTSYPAFPLGGQAAAFAALNAQAKQRGLIGAADGSIRAAWTGENAPDQQALGNLQAGLLVFTGCSGETSANPPTFSSCTPPAGSTGFTAADWTAVVNEAFAEIYSAKQATQFFSNLNDLRRDTFLAKEAELPAIADSLKQLAGAAGNQTELDPKAIFATGLSIAGTIAGETPLGAPLAFAAEIVSLIPSASPSLTAKFSGTYSELQAKFADAVTEADKALAVQSQEVRQNYGLLTLVRELTAPTGPWASLDAAGLKSSMEQGFATWAYRQLLPTLYARYKITGCHNNSNYPIACTLSGGGPETIGAPPSFTTIGPAPAPGGLFRAATPCDIDWRTDSGPCNFQALPGQISTKVWGPLADTCAYKPGDPRTAWTFSCSLGVNVQRSVSLDEGPANGWEFSNYCGDPNTHACSGASGSAVTGAHGKMAIRGSVQVPSGFRVDSATVIPNRLLYEPSGSAELVRGSSGRALGALHLTLNGGRGAFVGRPGAPLARLRLRAGRRGQLSYDLSLGSVGVALPAACQQLPPSESLATSPFTLDTKMRLHDGRESKTVALDGQWRCVRDRAGVISELRAVAPKRLPQRPGLAVSLAGPSTVTRGAVVTYRVRVHNRRHGPSDRAVSSLWHVIVDGFVAPAADAGQAAANPSLLTTTRRLAELRRGRSRTLALLVHIPGSAKARVCVTAAAGADSARPATARVCSTMAARPAGPRMMPFRAIWKSAGLSVSPASSPSAIRAAAPRGQRARPPGPRPSGPSRRGRWGSGLILSGSREISRDPWILRPSIMNAGTVTPGNRRAFRARRGRSARGRSAASGAPPPAGTRRETRERQAPGAR